MDLEAKSSPPNMDSFQDILLAKDQIIQKKSVVIAQQQRIEVLETYLRLARQKQFGCSSEKHSGQGEIFNEAELAACPVDEQTSAEDEQAPADAHTAPQKKRGRKGFSADIPREQIYIDLSEDEKEGAIDTFDTEVREELDIEPAKVRVLEYLQEKAVFVDDGQRRIKAATLPKHPIAKSMASIGLLACIIVAKYMDGLPLHRLESILKRYGGEVTRTSMANWIIRLATQCQPLIHLLRAHQQAGPLIQMDETRIQVHKEPGYSATGDKYMWVTLGGPPEKPVVLFDYDPSRGHEVALRLLDGYGDYLQSDGYSAYDTVSAKLTLTHLGCWDYARRKFKVAQPGKAQGQSKADIALIKIGKLYEIEREIKDLDARDRQLQRQQRSRPVLCDLKRWLDKNRGKAPKDALISEALVYLNNQWPKLICYCEDGGLPISNNRAEKAIRPFVIGRKAWLFADTPKGAHASGIFYSLVETDKSNYIEPYAYLRYLFSELPHAGSLDRLEALLPWNRKTVSRRRLKQNRRPLRKQLRC